LTGNDDGLNTTQLAIIGIVAILIIAAVALISFGKSGGAAPVSGTVPTTTTATTTAPSALRTLDPASITVPPTVSIAKEGIFIHVQYLGSYTGSYEADGQANKIWNSGDRLYVIENANQTITVSVQKTDRSAKQPLIVEVWKNGGLVKSASTTDLFGKVNLTATV